MESRLSDTKSQNSEEETIKQNNIEYHYDKMGNGKYQYIVCLLFIPIFYLWCIFFSPQGLFYEQPQFMCNGSICTQQDYCKLDPNQRSIVPLAYKTITQEFELYCDKNHYNSTALSLPYFGTMVGLFIFSFISDNLGRRWAIGLSILTATAAIILLVSFNSIVTICIGTFFYGFGITPCTMVCLAYLNEVTSGKFRGMSICLMYAAYGGSGMFVWPFSVITSDWRQFNIYFILIPTILSNVIFFYLFETPKFLLKKSYKQATYIFNKILNINQNDYQVQEQDIQQITTQMQMESAKKYSPIDLMKYISVRKTTLCLIPADIGIRALYYGIQLSLDLIGSNFAKSSFFVAIADFLGFILSDFVCPKVKRKQWFIITLLIPSVLCFTFLMDPVPLECTPDSEKCWQKTMQITQAVLARFSVAFAFSFLAIWTNELYPTSIRSTGYGFVAMIGFAGAQMTPYLKDLSQKVSFFNYQASIGFLGLLGCISTIFIRETFNQPTQEEITEIQEEKGIYNEDEVEDTTEIENNHNNQKQKLLKNSY